MTGIRDLLVLIPFLLSDGGLSPKGKNGFVIYFRNKDLSLVKSFENYLKKVTNNTIETQRRTDSSYMVRVNDLELGEKLRELCCSFRTKACAVFPSCPKISGGREVCKRCLPQEGYPRIIFPKSFFHDKELGKLFLQVYLSCDGGVSITSSNGKYKFLVRKVFVNVKHPQLRKEVVKLLQIYKTEPNVYGDQVRLTTKKDIKYFAREIGFINQARVGKDSRRFHGWTKNKLLNLVIKSYENPRKTIHAHFMSVY